MMYCLWLDCFWITSHARFDFVEDVPCRVYIEGGSCLLRPTVIPVIALLPPYSFRRAGEELDLAELFDPEGAPHYLLFHLRLKIPDRLHQQILSLLRPAQTLPGNPYFQALAFPFHSLFP